MNKPHVIRPQLTFLNNGLPTPDPLEPKDTFQKRPSYENNKLIENDTAILQPKKTNVQKVKNQLM